MVVCTCLPEHLRIEELTDDWVEDHMKDVTVAVSWRTWFKSWLGQVQLFWEIEEGRNISMGRSFHAKEHFWI